MTTFLVKTQGDMGMIDRISEDSRYDRDIQSDVQAHYDDSISCVTLGEFEEEISPFLTPWSQDQISRLPALSNPARTL